MKKNEEIGKTIFMISHRFSRVLLHRQAEAGLDQDTIMYGRILKFISDHERETLCQKDVEKVTGLNKSTVSMILSNMEKKELIERINVPEDARLKKLRLTEEGHRICGSIARSIRSAESIYGDGLTEEEQTELLRLLQKVLRNLAEIEEGKNS